MEAIVHSGDAADALRINQIYQSLTQAAYWESGGGVSPGSSTTQIEVDVASGEAEFSDSPVSWTATSVALADANSNPRVDVIYVQSDGSLHDFTGSPHAYRPNTDENGDPITPAPFEHWEPAPDDGSSFSGLPLACVLVEPTDADATDITTAKIQDRRLGALSLADYLRGDGEPNGATTVTVNDADFAVQDTTDTPAAYIQRDHSAGTLYLGSGAATPTFRTAITAATTPLTVDGGLAVTTGDLERGGQSALTSGDGAEQREVYVQTSQPSTSNPYIRFEPTS